MNEFLHSAEEDGAVYGMSSLVISSVVPELLDIPISCHLLNPAGQGQGTFRLHKGHYSTVFTLYALLYSLYSTVSTLLYHPFSTPVSALLYFFYCLRCAVYNLQSPLYLLYGTLLSLYSTLSTLFPLFLCLYSQACKPVEASPLRRGRKILPNIVENKKCRLPRLL